MQTTGTAQVIEHWYRALNFPAAFDAAFYQALERIEVPADVTLETYDMDSTDGKRNLLTFLFLCRDANDRALSLGIPENVIVDTFRDIVICTEDYTAVRGELCLGALKWLRLHLRLELFRLGRLQYRMGQAMTDIPRADVAKGDPVLEIHVPRGGKLDAEACKASITLAKRFFAVYFPEFRYKAFTCLSWLLDADLAAFLPESSNIVRFSRLFTRVCRTESNALLGSVFRIDTTEANLASAVCTSAFAQRVKDAVLSGKKFHMEYGYIAAKEQEENGVIAASHLP